MSIIELINMLASPLHKKQQHKHIETVDIDDIDDAALVTVKANVATIALVQASDFASSIALDTLYKPLLSELPMASRTAVQEAVDSARKHILQQCQSIKTKLISDLVQLVSEPRECNTSVMCHQAEKLFLTREYHLTLHTEIVHSIQAVITPL